MNARFIKWQLLISSVDPRIARYLAPFPSPEKFQFRGQGGRRGGDVLDTARSILVHRGIQTRLGDEI